AAGRTLHLALNAGTLRRLTDVTWWTGEVGADVQAAAVEIFGGLSIKLERLGAALCHANELKEPRSVRVAILAKPRHLVPEAIHGGASCLIAEIRQVAVDVVHGGAPLPGLDRAPAGNPHRRVRGLDRAWPNVDVALLIEPAVEREGVSLRPGAHHEVVGLVVALAPHARGLTVGEAGVHRRPDRGPGDPPSARNA